MSSVSPNWGTNSKIGARYAFRIDLAEGVTEPLFRVTSWASRNALHSKMYFFKYFEYFWRTIIFSKVGGTFFLAYNHLWNFTSVISKRLRFSQVHFCDQQPNMTQSHFYKNRYYFAYFLRNQSVEFKIFDFEN